MIPETRRLLLRDLATLRREIEAYPDDESLWIAVPGLPTAGGNLALHVVGNLRHFIGATLGATGYLRDRPAEFGRRGGTRSDLLALVAATEGEVDATLAALDPARLGAPFPLEVNGVRVPTGGFLLHLATHLAFHLGQMDYHRRALTGDPTSVQPMGVEALA